MNSISHNRAQADDRSGLIVIMPDRERSKFGWHVVWAGNEPGRPQGEFDGTRDDAIQWAVERSDNVLVFSVFSEAHQNVVPLVEIGDQAG